MDSVTFAAFVDAVAHAGKGKSGAARVSRFPPDDEHTAERVLMQFDPGPRAT